MLRKLLVLLVCLAGLTLLGCSAKKNGTPKSADGQKISYQDSVFLGFEGNLYDPVIIWDHMNIYLPAHDRLMKHVYLKDGRLAWDIKSGKEIKISENIFRYLTDAMTYENDVLLPGGEYGIYQMTSTGFYIVSKISPNIPDSLMRRAQ